MRVHLKCTGKDGIVRDYVCDTEQDCGSGEVWHFAVFDAVNPKQEPSNMTVKRIPGDAFQVTMMTHNGETHYSKKGIHDALIPFAAEQLKTKLVASKGSDLASGDYQLASAAKVWKRLVKKGEASLNATTARYECLPPAQGQLPQSGKQECLARMGEPTPNDINEKKCLFCENPATNVICCSDCQPIAVKYDSVRIKRAFSRAGRDSARIIIFQKHGDENTQHCLLKIKAAGEILTSEDEPFKTMDEALRAGEEKAKSLLGEGVMFEDVPLENPTDLIRQVQLLAGIPKTPE